jgi:uncharacterized protein
MTAPGQVTMSESKSLPERVDPRRLAATGGEVEGEVALAALTRLADYLLAQEAPEGGRARLHLVFNEDSQRRVRITGRLRASLTLQCQRCLGPATWPVDQSIDLIAVPDDGAAAGVPRDCEPVVAADGFDPAVLAEDELILALPLVARCCRRGCESIADLADTGPERTDNPFTALAAWKTDTNDGRDGG